MPHRIRQPDRDFKAYAYERVAQIGKAVSSAQRLVLLNILNNGPHSVEELAVGAELSVANASRHLQILKQARLVTAETRGKQRVYGITSPLVTAFLLDLRGLAANQLGDLRQALGEVAQAPTRIDCVRRDELLVRLERRDAYLVDVRPEVEYERAHLPGAVSIPLEVLHERVDELPREQEIITYCRGCLCLLADAAVDLLNGAGFAARRSDEDIPSWERAGLPVVRGPEPFASSTLSPVSGG